MIEQYEKDILEKIEALVKLLREQYYKNKSSKIKKLLEQAEQIQIEAFFTYSKLIEQNKKDK